MKRVFLAVAVAALFLSTGDAQACRRQKSASQPAVAVQTPAPAAAPKAVAVPAAPVAGASACAGGSCASGRRGIFGLRK